MTATRYLVTIGLEVHVQVKTESKMFCACATSYGDQPNSRTCPTCLGLPGALPVMNQEAIAKTVMAGQLLGSTHPETVRWDRKNYFYPDQAKNYQISQLDHPLCLGGHVPLHQLAYPKDHQKNIQRPDIQIRLNRIHLEEDVAKSTHAGKTSRLDFNRAGTPLMEIVSEPDIQDAEEAVAYLNALRQILVYGDISDADMDKGQMRCDVNISLRTNQDDPLGEKIELKNLNSTSAVRRAIHHEIERQSTELDQGIDQIQSTRRWDDDLGESQLLRSKEDAHDYRYFPDPDLLPVATAPIVASVQDRLPELPAAKKARFVEQYQISDYDANVLASERPLADYYEQCTAAAGKDAQAHGKKIANWVINTLLGKLNAQDLTIADNPIPAAKLTQLVQMVESGQLANNQAKEIFDDLWETPEADPAQLAKAKGFEPADSSELESMVDTAIAENPEKVAQIQDGNPKLANWLVGQVMKASKGKANPKMLTQIIHEKLNL